METVSHREMRNRSGEILRRVEAGESVQVTNNGHVAALIVPPDRNVLDALIERGQVRVATAAVDSLHRIKRTRSARTTAGIIADSRGDW